MFWICLILIASIVTQGECQYGSPCRTPDELQGICVPMTSCKPVFDFFKEVQQQNRSLSDTEHRQMQGLYCGTFSNVHHSCCVESDIQLNPQGLKVLQNQTCGATQGLTVSVYPWMALLIYDNEYDRYRCGGSLISEQYVLTAAHCVTGKEVSLSKVRLGEHRKSTTVDCVTIGVIEYCAPPTVDVGIAETIRHPQYRGAYNDIALIRLERKVQFQNHILPICLPIYDDLRAKVREQYVLAGWGKTEAGHSSDVLMVAILTRINATSCGSKLREYNFKVQVNTGHICAGGTTTTDMCGGDSGGPLGHREIYDGKPRFVQYGIAGTGLQYCGGTLPGLYTNVSHNIQWITDHIKK